MVKFSGTGKDKQNQEINGQRLCNEVAKIVLFRLIETNNTGTGWLKDEETEVQNDVNQGCLDVNNANDVFFELWTLLGLHQFQKTSPLPPPFEEKSKLKDEETEESWKSLVYL